MHDIARKMRGPDGKGRVMVLDVDHSSTKHHIYLGERASRHAYYLRPPDGMNANDFKAILDEAGGEEELGFRYWVYPELHTDLKPILTADPYAGKYFARDDAKRYLQIEGERAKARESIANLLDGLKEPFTPEEFPELSEFTLTSFKPVSEDRPSEVDLLRKDGNRNELRKVEPRFHIIVSELGYGREIDIHRPILAESEPVIILNSNSHTTEKGFKFLADLAAFFGSSTYAYQSSLAIKEPSAPTQKGGGVAAPTYIPHELRAPRIEPPKIDEGQLLARAALAMKEQLPYMKLLKKRAATQSGPHITIRFPGSFGFGKGPSEPEIREFASVYRAVNGDPSFGSNWFAYYQVDGRSGDMRVVTSTAPNPPTGWIAFRI
jgi:hypothetical protein